MDILPLFVALAHALWIKTQVFAILYMPVFLLIALIFSAMFISYLGLRWYLVPVVKYCYYAVWMFFSQWRAASKMKKANKAAMDQRVADGVTAFIEDLVHQGHMSRAQAQDYYTRMGNGAQLRDLLPQHRMTTDGKEEYVAAKKNEITANIGDHTPVQLPDGPKLSLKDAMANFTKKVKKVKAA